MASVIDNVVELANIFTDVALGDPVSFVLLLGGTALFAFTALVAGYLTLGAVVDLLTPDSSGRAPPRRA